MISYPPGGRVTFADQTTISHRKPERIRPDAAQPSISMLRNSTAASSVYMPTEPDG